MLFILRNSYDRKIYKPDLRHNVLLPFYFLFSTTREMLHASKDLI